MTEVVTGVGEQSSNAVLAVVRTPVLVDDHVVAYGCRLPAGGPPSCDRGPATNGHARTSRVSQRLTSDD